MSNNIRSYIDLVDRRHIILRVFDPGQGFSADNVHCANSDEAEELLKNLRKSARQAGLRETQEAPRSFMYVAGLSFRKIFAEHVSRN
jgi:hypothetical protein